MPTSVELIGQSVCTVQLSTSVQFVVETFRYAFAYKVTHSFAINKWHQLSHVNMGHP